MRISAIIGMKNSWILLAVLLIVALAFSPSLFNGFIKNDDPGHLLENPTLRALTLENFRAMFQSIINTTYIPLTTVSFAFEYHFFGYNPFVYHLDNLLLHLVVVALVFFFFQKLGLSTLASGIGALFFGIHPMHVESVAWVTERKDVLYASLYMASIVFYWRYVERENRIYYWASVAFGFCSILAKPMALSLPLILLLCDWWMGRTWKRSVFLEKIPYTVVAVTVAGITYLHNVRLPWHSFAEALMLWTWCFVFYIKKFFFPSSLIIFYQFPQPLTWANGEFLFSGFVFSVICVAFYYFRRSKLFVFALAFYFLSIFFLLRFDDVENINPVSDRFMYLPSVGFCGLLGAGFARLMQDKTRQGHRRKYAVLVLTVAVILASAKTFSLCRAWRDATILWSAVIERSPYLALAYVHRGAEYQEKGDLLSATEDYQKAIAIKDDAYAHSNLAMIYKQSKRLDDALLEYTRAIDLKPDFWGAYFDRGNLYRESGRYPLAIEDYTKVLQLLPGYSQAYANRGTAHFYNQEENLALIDFNRAIRFDPRAINAINNRAVIYARAGHFKKAILDFSRSISLDPKNPSVYFNRALAYRESRQFDLAIADFDQALKLDPSYKEAYAQKMQILSQR